VSPSLFWEFCTLNMFSVMFAISFSMMLLDGHPRNIILMTNSQMRAKSKQQMLQAPRTVQLLNLGLSGMKPQAITMMLLLVSITIQIQVMFFTVFGCIF